MPVYDGPHTLFYNSSTSAAASTPYIYRLRLTPLPYNSNASAASTPHMYHARGSFLTYNSALRVHPVHVSRVQGSPQPYNSNISAEITTVCMLYQCAGFAPTLQQQCFGSRDSVTILLLRLLNSVALANNRQRTPSKRIVQPLCCTSHLLRRACQISPMYPLA